MTEVDLATGPDLLEDLPRSLEALLVVLDRPLDPAEVAESWALPVEEVLASLRQLQARYADAHGFRLRGTASGWQLGAAEELVPRVRTVVAQESAPRLSQAALETLAVVAYLQPVSRTRVSAVRGVNVDAVVRGLTVRGLVEACDTDPVTGAALYRTTATFLDALGLASVDDLPELGPLLPDVETLEPGHE